MTWTAFDDGWDDCPKLLRAVAKVGVDAGWVWVRAVTYCNRKLTDGAIHGSKLRALASHRRPQDVVDALVEVGKLRALGDDEYEIHDFLDWNESRAQVESKREKKAAAGKKGGEAKARNANPPRPQEPPPGDGERLAPATPLVGVSYGGVSTPSPSPSPSASSKQRSPPVVPHGGTTDQSEVEARETEGDPAPDDPIPFALTTSETPVGTKTRRAAQVEAVWARWLLGWRREVGRGAEPILDSKRRRRVASRLDDGVALGDLCDAAEGIWSPGWNVEDYRASKNLASVGFNVATRDVEQVEKFAARFRAAPPARARSPAAPDPRKLEEAARQRRELEQRIRTQNLKPTGTE